MHFLDRESVTEPPCLQYYSYPEQKWEDLRGICKKELRAALVELQGEPVVSNAPGAAEFGLRCAYCESAIHHEGHIEHFRRKNWKHFPILTFSWDNLFLACGSTRHCGHFKDAPSSATYDPEELVKPDERDPRDFFFFSVQGRVYSREGLSESNKRVAEETIRVFNLNDPGLTARRRKALESHVVNRNDFLETIEALGNGLLSVDDEELINQMIRDWFQQEIEKARYLPYSSAVEDLFT